MGFRRFGKGDEAFGRRNPPNRESSIEYKDVHAFLDTTRNVFTSLDIYPERYSGLFGVTRDELSLAQKQLNHIAFNYSNHYPEEVLHPVRRDLSKTEQAILALEQFAFKAEDLKSEQKRAFWQKRNQAKIEYEMVRDELKRSLENIEIESEKFRAQSEQELSDKWEALKGQEDRNAFFLILGVGFYLVLISLLGFVTYKSLASPLRKLEQAAESSIDHNKPFSMVEVGPYEIRSLTRRLQGLIFGLEETVGQNERVEGKNHPITGRNSAKKRT